MSSCVLYIYYIFYNRVYKSYISTCTYAMVIDNMMYIPVAFNYVWSVYGLPMRDEFICEEDGFFPDPLDCTAYYVCIEGVPEWETCPEQLRLRWESPYNVSLI